MSIRLQTVAAGLALATVLGVLAHRAVTRVNLPGRPTADRWVLQDFRDAVYYPAVACWVFGNLLVLYLTILTCRLTRRYELILAALIVPVYWVMMSVAAVKALWQLVATPTFWEKTAHGLGHTGQKTRVPETASAA